MAVGFFHVNDRRLTMFEDFISAIAVELEYLLATLGLAIVGVLAVFRERVRAWVKKYMGGAVKLVPLLFVFGVVGCSGISGFAGSALEKGRDVSERAATIYFTARAAQEREDCLAAIAALNVEIPGYITYSECPPETGE